MPEYAMAQKEAPRREKREEEEEENWMGMSWEGETEREREGVSSERGMREGETGGDGVVR